jgi:hypothetical protein
LPTQEEADRGRGLNLRGEKKRGKKKKEHNSDINTHTRVGFFNVTQQKREKGRDDRFSKQHAVAA